MTYDPNEHAAAMKIRELKEEIAALEQYECVAVLRGYVNGNAVIEPLDRKTVLPAGMGLYRKVIKEQT